MRFYKFKNIDPKICFDDKHDAAMDGQTSPDGDPLEPIVDRGNVASFVTEHDAAMDRQPSPGWDSCEPGKWKLLHSMKI